MINIQYRKYNFKFKEDKGKKYIFDEIRKKYILLTPEEWVRQNFLHHLIYDLSFNKNKIALEKEFTVNQLKKRFDILVYDKNFEVFMIVECKAPEIKIDNKTAKQIFNYNIKFNAQYLVLTNGNYTFCLGKDKKWESKLPKYL
ncbi:MAG: type I restriction enzyme HsdR N-terminal domain-containing protein [Chitinophagales bacterium]